MTENKEQQIKNVMETWQTFMGVISSKVTDVNARAGLLALCEEQQSRIAACPSASRAEYFGAFPGGLAKYSLDVLKVMKELNKLYNTNLSTDDLIVTALFHNVGKIGSSDQDYYLTQESEWHRNKGMLYEINPQLQNIQPSIRSLWWLNHYAVPLTDHAVDAIASVSRMGQQQYSSEVYNPTPLTLVLQQAVRAVCALKNS
jgi:hypothetical protein